MSAVHVFDPETLYDSVADNYNRATSGLWPHVAANGIALARLACGAHVLDVACGPGHFALRAARAVGPTGRVMGVDVSEQMLTIARRHANAAKLDVDFRLGDLDALPFHAERFDAVTCGFGIFFSEDVPAALARLWELVRPGGRLVVVTLTHRFFTPLFDVFLEAAARQSPRDLQRLMPWRLTESPAVMRRWFAQAGAPDPRTVRDDALLVIDGPETWDLIETGTGIQRIATEIGAEAAARARAAVHDYIDTERIETVHLGALYTTATKPQR
jgi:ubiquinone/menaquinone biosynthesis C-methylase UbiE